DQPQGRMPEGERDVLRLSGREWLAVLTATMGLLALVPALGIRNKAVFLEPDYRMPYSLSHRYRLYQQFTTLASRQYPALLLGDSVIWGQCAPRDRTLSHYLNEEIGSERVANAGLDAMHPIALEGLLEYHAPAIHRKLVFLQFNPFWLMLQGEPSDPGEEALRNRPNLVPRLAAPRLAAAARVLEASWTRISRMRPWSSWIEGTLDSQLDFLAWSLSHPYESPLGVLRSPLPPPEDDYAPRLRPWNWGPGNRSIDGCWPDPVQDRQWQAFERILDRLESRGNRVLVIVGPINEHMLTAAGRRSYRRFTGEVASRLRSRGADYYQPPVLTSESYADICHPLAQGYREFARLLWEHEKDWLAKLPASR
ncbi:MAG TPA: hypothetical protein VKU80_18255, partial [Planctomycetota bacterium]|nr:hypothetical protein [Planctomycetota bacterium]